MECEVIMTQAFNDDKATQLLKERSDLVQQEQDLARTLICSPVDSFLHAVGLRSLTDKFARSIGSEDVVDFETKRDLDLQIRNNATQLDSMLATGLSDEMKTQIINELGYKYDVSVYDSVNQLDVLQDIERTDFVGSRGYGKATTQGYFSAKSETLGDVVLYRGTYDTYEQAALINLLDSLNEDTRELFPEVHGTYVDDGVTYLVMEKFPFKQDSQSLSSQAFLDRWGDSFSDDFSDAISRYGLNLGRTTIEYDYLFGDDQNEIRMGIPYRALEFTREAKNGMLHENSFKKAQPVVENTLQLG